MSAATLGSLIGTLVAARRAGGYRYHFPERVLRQFAGHCRQEGYADGSIVKEAVEEFLYGRHLKAATIRREEVVLRELAGHARQFGWHAWAPPALTAVKKPHRRPPARRDRNPQQHGHDLRGPLGRHVPVRGQHHRGGVQDRPVGHQPACARRRLRERDRPAARALQARQQPFGHLPDHFHVDDLRPPRARGRSAVQGSLAAAAFRRRPRFLHLIGIRLPGQAFPLVPGLPLLYYNVGITFARLARRAGLAGRSGGSRPRPHDLRH